MTAVPLPTLDLDARYRVSGFGGIAFWLKGHATETYIPDPILDCHFEDTCNHDDALCWILPEAETVEDPSLVVAVMVGDDREHYVATEDLIILDDLDYCASCGQIGCTHDGRER